MDTERKRAFIISVVYLLMVVALIYVTYKFLIFYLLPFIIGLALAYFLQKPSAFIAQKLRVKKGIVSAVLVVVSFLLVVGAIFGGAFLIYLNTDKIVNYLQNRMGAVTEFFENISEKYNAMSQKMPEEMVNVLGGFADGMSQKFNGFLTDFVSRFATSVLRKLPGAIFSVTITVIASCYIAKDYDAVKDYILSLIPKKPKKIVLAIKRIVTVNVLKIIKGYLILTVITFGELYVAFLLTAQAHPFRTALLISFIDFLPVLGTGAALVPWGVILMLNGNYMGGFTILIIYFIVLVVRNFLEPKIVGKQMGIPPIVSLILLFCGLKLFGFLGMIFSILSLVVVINLYKEKVIEL